MTWLDGTDLAQCPREIKRAVKVAEGLLRLLCGHRCFVEVVVPGEQDCDQSQRTRLARKVVQADEPDQCPLRRFKRLTGGAIYSTQRVGDVGQASGDECVIAEVLTCA